MNTLSSRSLWRSQGSAIRLILQFLDQYGTPAAVSRVSALSYNHGIVFPSTTGAGPMDFPYCYRILGLPPECDWEQARHRYQQLVSRLHPDRPSASGQKQSLTEINLAWRQLRKYYQQHGHLPLQTNGVSPAARPVTPFEPAPATVGSHGWRRWLTIMAMPIALLLLWPDRTPPPHPAEFGVALPPVTVKAESSGATAVRAIRYGDPLGYVVETLGPPHDIRSSRWYYGDSWIELRDGRVSDWHSSVDHPLPTDTLSHHQR